MLYQYQEVLSLVGGLLHHRDMAVRPLPLDEVEAALGTTRNFVFEDMSASLALKYQRINTINCQDY